MSSPLEQISQTARPNSNFMTAAQKSLKLESQKVGNFIVKANEAINFQISGHSKSEDAWFSPKFSHQIFGEKEEIRGYEGLAIDITLSPKFLVPMVRVSHTKKVPDGLEVKADNIEETLSAHYGKIYTEASAYHSEVLEKEKALPAFGTKVGEVKSGDKEFDVHKVCMNEENFVDHQYYMQAILTFFIDAASKVQASRYWHFFILYEKESGNIAGFICVYEAHKSADEFRTKLSLAFIYPNFQRMGLGSKLYESVLAYYQKDCPNCYELIVEDANEDFQKVQDIVNAKMLIQYDTKFRELLGKTFKGYLHTADQVKQALAYDITEVNALAKKMKLPAIILIRLYDLIVYSHLEGEQTNPGVHRAYRLMIKKRLLIRCFKTHTNLVHNKQVEVEHKAAPDYVETTPYIWNSSFEGDELCQVILQEEESAQEQLLIDVACKQTLGQLYESLVEDFRDLKPKLKGCVA